MPRVTLHDPRHCHLGWAEVRALSDLTGLKPQVLAAFRPARLALHSVLIRVTCQLYVPDGPSYADLGIHLRDMAATIYGRHVMPRIAAIEAEFEALRGQVRAEIEALLEAKVYGALPPPPPQNGRLARLFGRPAAAPAPPAPEARALAAVEAWQRATNEDLPLACRRALGRTLGSVLNRHGRLLAPREVIAEVATGLVMNRLGSALVGQLVSPIFDAAARAEGYRRLPPQAQPVVLNAKGASAAGKSSIRGAQRQIAQNLGLDWRDFAIISPDYWRKALIDYGGLGEDYKYAAMLTGHELEIIDRKLDILMAVKARRGEVPHMLIDRFRFDSFHSEADRPGQSSLLTRYGAKVYMFFLVTPPAATVERAWARGLETGRYKAVDDLLDHNIEAYQGMPDLFFTWALGQERWVHYEFLDNAVPQGETPRSIAYGRNGVLVVRDLDRLCDIERFRHVDVEAKGPDEVLSRVLSQAEAMAFVRRCMAELTRVEVLVPGTATVYARAEGGGVTIDLARVPAGVEPASFGAFTPAAAPLGETDPALAADAIGA